MKAKLTRSDARPKTAKAAVRASGLVLKQSSKPRAAKVGARSKTASPKPPARAAVGQTPRGASASALTKTAAPASPVRGRAASSAPGREAPPTKPSGGAKAAAKPAGAVRAKAPAQPVALTNAAPAKPAARARAASARAAVTEPSLAKTPAPSVPAPVSSKKPARKSIKEAAGVSTDAVARRTGKTWDDWFEVLDSAGAALLDQRGIVAILAQKHGIGPWWQQTIAVGYESLRGKNEKPGAIDGFQISKSCTLDAPVGLVFRLWNDAGERARWLSDERFVVRGATADKLIRARWGKGNSHVAVSFNEKSGRTEVSVEHHQIESRSAAEQMKAYWAKKLGLLDEALAPRR